MLRNIFKKNAPCGHIKDEDGRLMIDGETAPAAELIFRLRAEGSGPGKLHVC